MENQNLVDAYVAANRDMLIANSQLMNKMLVMIRDQIPALIRAVEEDRLGERITKNTIVFLESISDEEMEKQRVALAQMGAVASAMSLDQFRIAQSELLVGTLKPIIDQQFKNFGKDLDLGELE